MYQNDGSGLSEWRRAAGERTEQVVRGGSKGGWLKRDLAFSEMFYFFKKGFAAKMTKMNN